LPKPSSEDKEILSNPDLKISSPAILLELIKTKKGIAVASYPQSKKLLFCKVAPVINPSIVAVLIFTAV
jgi:hypothetical protein